VFVEEITMCKEVLKTLVPKNELETSRINHTLLVTKIKRVKYIIQKLCKLQTV